jgi:putative salt-induced outer membrane protein YdiY
MKYFNTLILASGLAAGNVLAADNEIDHTGNVMMSAEIGAISTSGNTAGTSVTGRFEILQDTLRFSNEYTGNGYFKEDRARVDGEETKQRSAERYQFGAKAGYKLLEENSTLFALAAFSEDKFGAYTRSASVGVGHGSRWYQSDNKTLDMEFGPGYFSATRANGEQDQGLVVRGRAAFRWKLSDNASFAQMLTVERASWNTHSTSETSLSARLNGSMHMKAAFSAINDSNVPFDKQNTDTQTSVTLVYSF